MGQGLTPPQGPGSDGSRTQALSPQPLVCAGGWHLASSPKPKKDSLVEIPTVAADKRHVRTRHAAPRMGKPGTGGVEGWDFVRRRHNLARLCNSAAVQRCSSSAAAGHGKMRCALRDFALHHQPQPGPSARGCAMDWLTLLLSVQACGSFPKTGIVHRG